MAAAIRANPTSVVPSPLGAIELQASPRGLCGLKFLSRGVAVPTRVWSPPVLKEAADALSEYFSGNLKSFDIPLDLSGVTPFQRTIYELLVDVPFGTITTYGSLAEAANLTPEASRAVGGAVGANPLPIIIPCHRVIRTDRKLGGYSGGLDRKVELLRLEGIDVGSPHPNSTVHPEALRLPF